MSRNFLVLVFALAVCTVLNAQTPPAPTNVTAQAVGGTSPRIVINWQSLPGPWFFNLYRSADDSLHFSRRGEVLGSHSFEDRNVVAGRRYFYYLRAVLRDSEQVESPRSSIVSAVVVSISNIRGTIRGTVSDDSTGVPLRNVRVRFYRSGSNFNGVYDLTDSLGLYEAVLDSGRYIIHAEPEFFPTPAGQYLAGWFDNVSDPSRATGISVGNQTTFTANFRLRRFIRQRDVHIQGTVTNEQGTPLSNSMVAVMRSIQEMNSIAAREGRIPGIDSEARTLESIGYCRGVLWFGRTDPQGRFDAEVPQSGSYIVAAARQGYYLQYFNRVSDPTQATIIAASNDTSGVNFFLRLRSTLPNSVRGTVRDSTGTQVPSRVILFPRPPHPTSGPVVIHSDSSGNYVFTNVEQRTYFVLAVPYSNYTAGFYKEGAYGVAQWQLADSVVVAGNVATANVGVVTIQSNGLTRVSGTSTARTGEPLVGGRIVVQNSSGQVVGHGLSTAGGGYVVDALPVGQVTLVVDGEPYNPQQIVVNIPPGTYSLNNINVLLTRAGATEVGQTYDRPVELRLQQNYPNPFNPKTVIRFEISDVRFVSLKVYDVLGQEVAPLVNEMKGPGVYSVGFDAQNLPSGVYYYRLSAGAFTEVKKMISVK